ncbi:hypothetical protein ElyMa_001642300 [Elysia marginata]|uniref:Uncharacterized protein n=1 Tax=Elysia marginata TaxID=1093978 RepID=A0AAV4JQ52_9GAST|nr:hypothetical protein ElyMa_001642300 [Elysia marginata]
MELVRVTLGDAIRDCPVDTAGGEIDLSTLNSYESPMQCPVELETSRLVVEPYMMSFGLIMLTVNVRDTQNMLFQKRVRKVLNKPIYLSISLDKFRFNSFFLKNKNRAALPLLQPK